MIKKELILIIILSVAGILSCNHESEIMDYRDPFIGTYTGYRDCSAWNTDQLHPDQEMAVLVAYGNNQNTLLVNGEEVVIDSSGAFPYPYFNGYRIYALHFQNDSLFLFQQWGVLNANESCRFEGEKQ